ncbi:hypothetical protein ST43_02540 [Prevotella pectinovora]|nr:hypothetical protein ST43_02540 [Prevotella pectinovora]
MNLFCIALDLDKNFSLGNVNKFPFLSLNQFFALSLDKVGCISAMKINKFILHCSRFALPLQT